jgi:hypothetical protein
MCNGFTSIKIYKINNYDFSVVLTTALNNSILTMNSISLEDYAGNLSA